MIMSHHSFGGSNLREETMKLKKYVWMNDAGEIKETTGELPKGWNNLKNNSLENILKKYSEVINHENWSDEKSCPGICMRFCGKKQQGKRQTYYEKFNFKSVIDEMSVRELQIMSSKILSNENATSGFIKQFNADHDSVQFYKNVILWYAEKNNELPE